MISSFLLFAIHDFIDFIMYFGTFCTNLKSQFKGPSDNYITQIIIKIIIPIIIKIIIPWLYMN